METKVVGYSEFAPLAQKMFKEAIAAKDPLMAISIVVLSGDRITCCDEAIVFTDDPEIGMATISPDGEMRDGTPTIVGVYVRSADRGKGLGTELMAAAVRRCMERGFEKIRVDVLTIGSKRAVEKLPAELRARLEVTDNSGFLGL